MADANIIVKIIDQTSGGINNITRQVDNVERSVKKTNTAFVGVNRALGAFVGFLGARELLRFANDVQTINNQIRLVTSSQEELNTTFDQLLKLANDTRGEFGAVTELYSKLALATQDLGVNQETLLTVTKSFNQLLAIAGAETQAAEGATRQFAQALASGAFRGDEFNSVVEAAPGILDVLAQELGVTRGEVRALAGDGEITAEVLVRALTASAETIDQQFGQTSVTIGQALTVLQNNFLALGNEASPVLDNIAKIILVVAENLDIVVAGAAAMAGAFVFTQAVAALAALRTAIVAVNIAIAANPIGAVATAIALAITGIYVYWDDLKAIAVGAFESITESYREFENFIVNGFNRIKIAGLSIWTGIQTTYLEFETALLRGVEGLINTVVGGFTSFANEITAQFKAVAAAAQDPLNAFEAYNTALEESRKELEQNSRSVVDFSGVIRKNEDRIDALNAALDDEIKALEDNAKAVEDNAGEMENLEDAVENVERQTEDTMDATENFTDATDDLTEATELSVTQQERAEQALREAEAALAAATAGVDDYINSIETETDAIGMSQKERKILAGIIENEERIREALGDTIDDLTQEEIRLIQRAVRENETATLTFLQLSDDRIQAIIDVIDENERATDEFEDNERRKQDAQRDTEDFIADSMREVERINRETMTEVERITQEKEDFIREAEERGLADHQSIMDRTLAYDQQIRDAQVREAEQAQREQARITREAQRETERFIAENERMVRTHYRSTLDEVERLEMDRAELIEEANRRGLANHESTQNAILAIDNQIADARIEAEERVRDERARLLDEQVSKYGTIYSDMEKKLLDFVGINQSEFKRINEYAELFFGVNIRDIIRGTFAQGTLAIEGFRNDGQVNLQGFGGWISNLFANTGVIGNAITSVFDGSIFSNFVRVGKDLLGGLGGFVSNLFGGIGNTIGSIFSGRQSGNLFSGIVNTVSSVFSGGGILGGVADFIGGLFFDEGGTIPGGSAGIVGEFGPEIVRGPAQVTSRRETAAMMGGGAVNVNFTVNAIDAKDLDRLLVEKQDVIKNIVQNAVNQRGRRI